MTLDPILFASPILQAHTLAALVAFLLGPIAILRRKRDLAHKIIGRVWVVAMLVTALSALGITEIRVIGPFSPLHGFSIFVVVMLWRAIAAIRAGNLVAHGRIMTQIYVGAMGIAGLFTLLPGRRMHEVLLAGTGWTGFGLAASVALIGVAILWRAQPGENIGTGAHFPLFKPSRNR